ncbi:MAG TPA: FAD-binding oxidoreductase [Kofleriaceae bacterium]|nr:FAD-binding oxidoreductase [Kofleriaceae bacterium]
MAKALEYNATLVERIDITDALTLFRIKPDDQPAVPWFVPGQYCVLGLNNETVPALGSVRRSMSIASSAQHEGPIEFYIRFVAKPASENPLTHLLWKLKAGDRMYMRAHAAGVFTVADTVGVEDPRIRILVAAGTGSAPFVSMVRTEIARNPNVDLSKWVILHGASYAADLGHRDELNAMVAKHRLRYWGTVSRPDGSPGWRGDTGRVEAFFEPGRLEDLEARIGLGRGELTPKTAMVMICGLQGTISGTLTALLDRGFVPDFKRIREALAVPETMVSSLFYEQYDHEPVIDIKNPESVAPLKARLHAALVRLGVPT